MRIIPIILFCLFSLNCGVSVAQPVHHTAFSFQTNTSAEFDRTAFFSPGPSGPGVIWDFSGMQMSGNMERFDYKHPEEVDLDDDFPAGNIVELRSEGGLMLFNQNGNKTYLSGLVEPAYNMSVPLDNHVLLYVRPVEYGDSMGSNAKRSFSFRGFGFSGEGVVYATADSYGTLILPRDTLEDVLRIKTVHDFTDRGPLGLRVESYVVSYSWMKQGSSFPVLSMDSLYRNDPFTSASEVITRYNKSYLEKGSSGSKQDTGIENTLLRQNQGRDFMSGE